MNESHNWKATPRGHYILFFDVAIRNTGSKTAIICRSDDGTPIFVIPKLIDSQNLNRGKATTMYIGRTKA